jgi:hypothetical protein
MKPKYAEIIRKSQRVAPGTWSRVGIKKPNQKNPPKKTHLKKPTKSGFFWFFLIFNFL